MQASIATVTLVGIAPYTQSRQHGDPKLEGESPENYDIRTWPSKMTTEVRDGKPTVVIPAHGIHQCLTAAARYSKRQIPGQGKATWTKKFEAGITLIENAALNIDPATVSHITISANTDGVRGSGKRVLRRLPSIPAGWSTTFDIYVLDPILLESIFREMVETAGMFIGLGQFRPENGGTSGRFRLDKLVWQDNRQIAA